MNIKKILITVAPTLFPFISFAQNIQTAPNIPITTGWVIGFICNILSWMFWGLIVLSVAMALVAGYLYVTSAGNPEKVGRAGRTLMYAAIGIAVAIIAKGVPLLVGDFLGAGSASLNAC